jgi:histidinol-phosphate aminotransferase
VVAIDVQVALGLDGPGRSAVARDLVQHVVEKTDAGGQRLAPVPSRSTTTRIWVSAVLRVISACRMAVGIKQGEGVHDTIGLVPRTPRRAAFSTCHTASIRIAMSRFWSDVVKGLTPYVPGEQPKLANLIKLNTNENPYGPSPRALEAIRAAADESLKLYPDPNADALKRAIAALHGLAPQQVFVGNGSDEVLAHVFLGLLKHERPVLFPDISYSFYPVYCGLYQIAYETVALGEDFSIRTTDYAKPNGGIIFPNPNAPTGLLLALDEIGDLLGANRRLGGGDRRSLRRFWRGKRHSADCRPPQPAGGAYLVQITIAGRPARRVCGGTAELIEALERVKNSFNSYPLDRLAIAGAVAAIEDRGHFESTRRAVIATREKLVADLSALGFEVIPSAANFVFARHSRHDAEKSALALRQRSIIVRHFKAPRIDQFLRITVGTDAQCEALIAALKEILG